MEPVEVQTSALAALTAAVSEMCYRRAGMNHFATALLWGNNTELHCFKELIARNDLVSFLQAARQALCCRGDIRGRYGIDVDTLMEGAAHVFISVCGFNFCCCGGTLMTEPSSENSPFFTLAEFTHWWPVIMGAQSF